MTVRKLVTVSLISVISIMIGEILIDASPTALAQVSARDIEIELIPEEGVVIDGRSCDQDTRIRLFERVSFDMRADEVAFFAVFLNGKTEGEFGPFPALEGGISVAQVQFVDLPCGDHEVKVDASIRARTTGRVELEEGLTHSFRIASRMPVFDDVQTITNQYGMSINDWAGGSRRLHVGDFNRDGASDLLLQGLHAGADSFLLLANGQGSFNNVETITNQYGMSISHWAGGSRRLHVGDFNRDGASDLLLQGLHAGADSFLLLANGLGGFNNVETITNQYGMSINHWAGGSRRLHVGDFNRDGASDLLLQGLHAGADSFLLLANGLGGFNNVETITNQYGMSINHWAGGSRRLHVGDFNRDGASDLLLQGLHAGADSFLLLANGQGSFNNVETITNQYGMSISHWAGGSRRLHVGDFNRDGASDLLLQGLHAGADSFLLLANGQGGFNNVETITNQYGMSISHWAGGSRRLHVGDFNGDGASDLLLQGLHAGADSFLLLANGQGGFSKVQTITNQYGMSINRWAGGSRRLHVGDFNAGGASDLLLQGLNADHDSFLLAAFDLAGLQPIGKDKVTFEPTGQQTLVTNKQNIESLCRSSDFDGYFLFLAKLKNHSGHSLEDLAVRVGFINNGNVLVRPDLTSSPENWPPNAGIGDVWVLLRQFAGYQDGILSPGESADFGFGICLAEIKRFSFFVGLLGAVSP